MSTSMHVPQTHAPQRAEAPGAPRVLLIGADQQLRRALRVTLTSAGNEVVEARTGEEALDKLRTEGGVDLVVLDLELSGIGGQQTCQRIRKLGNIPILAISVYRDQKDKAEACHAGASDYLVKPFGIQDLLSCMHKLRGTKGALEFKPPA